MKTVTGDALTAAESFVMRNARLLDRLRFGHHFRGESAEAVVAALRPYRNPDGGFGNALEPDLRGAGSQPVPVELALHILDEVDGFADPMVAGACDYLLSIARPDGGVPWVLPSVRDTPRGPWWQADDEPAGSLNPTAGIVGLLHKRHVAHPWVEGATRFCRHGIDGVEELEPYQAHSILTFLQYAPDRSWAARTFERLRPALLACIELDPHAEGEVHRPLDFAPSPHALARELFSDEVIERHLDALVEAQAEDGAWRVNFLVWNPLNAHEWNSFLTVQRLLTLRDYGRLVS